jgi:hypothetical protein
MEGFKRVTIRYCTCQIYRKHEEKRQLERSRRSWKYDIKIDLKEYGWKDID